MSSSHKHCYASLTSPSMTDAINLHNYSALKLSVLVAEFAQQMAAAHEHFSKEIQSVIATFRRRNYDLNKERPVEQPSTIFKAWECLLQESEMDAQAHLDAASLLIKNVYKPLEMVASYKSSQAQKLCSFRDNFENILSKSENSLQQAERGYYDTYETFSGCTSVQGREAAKKEMYNAHNDYVLQLRASNKIVDEFHEVIPQVLEELEEIYIDTSNTINVAIESHALLLLTKAKEQHRRYDDLLKICRQVSPHVDISHFVKTMCQEQGAPNTYIHHFQPADLSVSTTEVAMKNQLIIDGYTEPIMNHKRKELQREAVELASFIKRSQDVTTSLISICQRNLANHMYAKVYETQEDLCHKRNEIRVANMQLAGVRAQMDMVMPKQNGSVVEGVDQQEEESDMKHSQSSSAIKGMWKKAFKNLKSNEKQTSLKKGSLRRKDSKDQEEEESEERDEIDPVYSLLKCAADLPKASKVCGIHSQCSGHHSKHGGHGDSSASTSKTSSPSSSASHSPKTRRKKLNARMKSFSLDTPDPPKQLLGIDETTKKKSSSFTNTCFGGTTVTSPNSPVDTMTSASYRKKLGFSHRSSSLEIEERKHRSHTPSPLQSPKSKRKDTDVYVVLYNFKGKEKDDMDLRAGWKVNLINSSDPDWWKGRCNGKVGYFPATYVQRLVPGQRVFQVTHTMNLSEGDNGMRLHKDQIVVQVGEEVNGMIHVQAPNKKQAMCPMKYLQEL
ncbi:uncharacterized protein LOC124114609 isoform X1 [Haliotis rufescens]|uniref:uncharacterized protein LOC124114609 isoform X1 n=1 Tax=Haliotis rufescens TaxID=6454 RepID=UPI00201ED5D8|nr:uncharacterized protein LOC124114609 isoform X1 [Haliotis rufescens]XP_048241792.1 uncharacterized protein LOC124114609 isoform X1 [Haliotis rufescens]